MIRQANFFIIDINEADFLDVISTVSNFDSLSVALGIHDNELTEIKSHPLEHHKQLLLSAFIRNTLRENCTLERVNKAVSDVEAKDLRLAEVAKSLTGGI